MEIQPRVFEPPAPVPRSGELSRLEILRTVLRNPLELWSDQSYTLPWIETRFINRRTLIVNDPGLIRHILPENREALHRFQYLPFGAGPRTCIGATFALQEAVIALGVLMKRSRFDVTPRTKPWPVQRLTTQPRGGIRMRVTRR